MKIFKAKYLIALALPLSLGLFSCERTIEEPEGPKTLDLFGPFELLSDLSADKANVDFSNGEDVTFSAEQLTAKNWTLTLTGQTSGAVKVLTGQSSSIQATWDGSTTNLPLFREESVEAVLTFEGQDTSLTTTITVDGRRTYDEAYIVEDFEGSAGNWTLWGQSGVSTTQVFDNSAEGTGSFNVTGLVTWDWAVGTFRIDAESGSFPLSAASATTYFNMMATANTLDPEKEAFLLIDFLEDDNNDGTHDPATEDMFRYRYDFTETGWQFVSIPYEDAVLETTGVDGNGSRDSHKIVAVNIIVLQDQTSTQAADINLDFLSFTQNGPLVP